MLVDFMIIGAQKCGTTSLAAQLAQHPDVCFCRTKEPGYFNATPDWQSGLDAYHALYTPEPNQVCGEASTMYTFLPDYLETHARLHAYNPDLKLIYVMRDPVERVISNYAHNVVRQIDTRPPEEAIFTDPGYINRSRYAVQIRPYIELFGRENVLLLVFEEYIADQIGALQKVASFIRIDGTRFEDISTEAANASTGSHYLKYQNVEKFAGSGFFQSIRDYIPAGVRQPVRRLLSNQIAEKPEFSPSLRAEIARWLVDDAREIEAMLGRSVPAWQQTTESAPVDVLPAPLPA